MREKKVIGVSIKQVIDSARAAQPFYDDHGAEIVGAESVKIKAPGVGMGSDVGERIHYSHRMGDRIGHRNPKDEIVWWIRRCTFCRKSERMGELRDVTFSGQYDRDDVRYSVVDKPLLDPCAGPFRIGPFPLDTVITGDAFEHIDRIAKDYGRADMVIGDPIYEAIHHYFMLTVYANRVLTVGGSLLMQAGSNFRFDAEKAARNGPMEPRPLMAEIFPAATGSMYRDRTLIGFREWLWFTRRPANAPKDKITARRGGWIFNRLPGGGRDKSAHKWGDSIRFAYEAIIRLTKPGDIVIVPFAGGGAELAAAKKAGRHYIGFEIDPGTAAKVRARLNQTAWPVMAVDPEPIQMALEFGGSNGAP